MQRSSPKNFPPKHISFAWPFLLQNSFLFILLAPAYTNLSTLDPRFPYPLAKNLKKILLYRKPS